jgi:hypothetical protein
MQKKDLIFSKNTSGDEPSGKDLLHPVLLAEYKKRDKSAISTAMNQIKNYLVSAVTFLSKFGITDQPIFGLVVHGMLAAITMAWKTHPLHPRFSNLKVGDFLYFISDSTESEEAKVQMSFWADAKKSPK